MSLPTVATEVLFLFPQQPLMTIKHLTSGTRQAAEGLCQQPPDMLRDEEEGRMLKQISAN